MEKFCAAVVFGIGSAPWVPIQFTPMEPAEETQETEPVTPETEAPVPETEEQLPAAEVLETPSNEETDKLPVGIMLVCAAGAATVVVILVLVGKGRKKNDHPEDAIPMRLEIITGKCKTSQRQFYLSDELLIGTDKHCDVVFKERSLSPKHCRIYIDGPYIWIEDLNDKTNTSIDGMKIYAPNRLRSGSKLTMGKVCIRFFF